MANSYFVSPTGTAGNLGTQVSPWNLSTARSNWTHGDTLIFHTGYYPSIVVNRANATVRSLVKWGAIVTGNPAEHGIYNNGGTEPNMVVDGFLVSGSKIDGVKFNAPSGAVRNCWITSNTNQGVAGHNFHSILVENNLIERNGSVANSDHGIYLAGSGITIRNNVIRYNGTYGIQLYDATGDCINCNVYNNVIINNLRGMVIFSYLNYTNYIYNNLIVNPTGYVLNLAYGKFVLRNNIFVGASNSNAIIDTVNGTGGVVLNGDYNIFTKFVSGFISGGHSVTATDIGFVNSGNGLYWLKSTSVARNAGTNDTSGHVPVDFFGNSGRSISDIGPFQYNYGLTFDTRTLYPSSRSGANYWDISFLFDAPGGLRYPRPYFNGSALYGYGKSVEGRLLT